MNTVGTMKTLGKVAVAKNPKAPLSWRVRNSMRWLYIWGLISTLLAKALTKVTGFVTLTSELRLKLIHADGSWEDYGVVARRLVTDAFVAFVVDDWDGGANDISLFNYHGCGTGVTAEAANQTALVTESTTALNPDSTRATGTKSQPSANVMQTVGTATFDASAAITEHAVFTQAATGGGTMMDRSLFTAVNVVSGDSIQFTYQLTLNSGG